MNVGEWLKQAQERLRDFPSPHVDARLLAEHVMGRPLDSQAEVSLETLEPLLQRRLKSEPVQYITGQAPFRYLVLAVGQGVLIPRPETELLVDVAKAEIAGRPLKVADLGAGSGAIAISIATETSALVTAVEKDPEAFAWLTKNVATFAPSVECLLADVTDVDLGGFDVVVANPPYVPDGAAVPSEVVDFEPAVAIFGGDDGTSVPRAFIERAHSMLRPGGLLILEHSDSHQDLIVKIASDYFTEVVAHKDLLDRPRFITARKA